MTAPQQHQKKTSSRWYRFKKNRKKNREENEIKIDKSSSSPPRSDATSANSGANATRSLLGRIVTKKRSKRNLNVEEDEAEPSYVPPKGSLTPSFDALPADAPAQRASSAQPELAPTTATLAEPKTPATVPPTIERVESHDEVSEKEPSEASGLIDAPSSADETNSPKSEKEDRSPRAVSSPSTFLYSLREAAASPTTFLSEMDAFGFPSSPKAEASPDVKDDDTWTAFLHPFLSEDADTASKYSPRPSKPDIIKKAPAEQRQSPLLTERKPLPERKPVASIMEKAHVEPPQFPLLSEQKPVVAITKKTPVEQQQSQKSKTAERSAAKKIDPPGAKATFSSVPKDPFGEDSSVFSSLAWDTEELDTLPSSSSNEIVGNAEKRAKETRAKGDESAVATKSVVPSRGLSREDSGNLSLSSRTSRRERMAKAVQEAKDSEELSLSQRRLRIKRMAKARMEKEAKEAKTAMGEVPGPSPLVRKSSSFDVESPKRPTMERQRASSFKVTRSHEEAGQSQAQLPTKQKPVAANTEKAPVDQSEFRMKCSDVSPKIDPPGTTPSLGPDAVDPFEEGSVFSSLTWDGAELGALPSSPNGEAVSKMEEEASKANSEEGEEEAKATMLEASSEDLALMPKEPPSSSKSSTPTPDSAAKLKTKAVATAAAHKKAVRRGNKAVSTKVAPGEHTLDDSGVPDKSSTIAQQNLAALDSISEIPEPPQLARKSSSFDHVSAEQRMEEDLALMPKEPPSSSKSSTPTPDSAAKLKTKAVATAAAHKKAVRRGNKAVSTKVAPGEHTLDDSGVPDKSSTIAQQNLAALDSISEIPEPPQLARKSSSFDHVSAEQRMEEQLSRSFELSRSQLVGSKVVEHAASSRGTELYMKRHQRHVVDKYDLLEQDDDDAVDSAFSSPVDRWSGVKTVLEDRLVPRTQPSELTELVTVEDGHEDEIEIVIPEEPDDALCKFEAYYSESELNESTASCTDVTSEDLHGDGSWSDTNTLDESIDESRSDGSCEDSRTYYTEDTRTNYTYDTKSQFTEASTSVSTEETMFTVTTNDDSGFAEESLITVTANDDSGFVEDDSTLNDSTVDKGGESLIVRGWRAVTNDYISDEESSGDGYGSEVGEDEPVDSYFWENIAERLVVPGSK